MPPWEKYQSAQPAAAPWLKYQAAEPAPTAEPSFIDRVSADWDKRNQQAQEIQRAVDTGQQGALQTGLQIVGLGAGKANDVVGEAMTSVGQGIAAITPDMIKQPISEAATSAIESDAGQTALQGAGYIADKYGQLKQEYPNAMRSVEAVGNIVGAVPVGLGALKGGQKVATSAGEKAIELATTKKRNLSTQIAKKEASGAAYEEALGSGVVFPTDFSGKMAETGRKYMPKTEFQAKLMAGSPSNRMAELVQEFNGKPLTIEDVDLLDKKLTDEAFGLWNTQPSEAKKISEIQDSLRETLSTYPVGGKLKEARDLWAQQAKMRDLMKIQEVAEMTDNPATSIRTAVKNLIKNDKRFKSYTPEEQELLRKAAKTGLVTDALRVAGSRLNAIGAGVSTGNPVVAGAVYGAGAVARKGAEKIQGGKLNKVIQAVSERPVGQADKAMEASGSKMPKYPAMEPLQEKPRYTPPAREDIRRPNLKTKIKNLAKDESGSVGGLPDDFDLEALLRETGNTKTSKEVLSDGVAVAKLIGNARPQVIKQAKELGFDTDRVVYRGLGREYDEARAGSKYYQMFTHSGEQAGEYAEGIIGKDIAPNVVPAFLRKGKNLSIDAAERNFNALPTSSLPKEILDNLHNSASGRAITTDELAHAAKNAGYDSVTIRNVFDNAWGERTGKPTTVDVVFDPKNIRSVNAKFDPSKANSADLMALRAPIAVSGAGGAAAYALSPQDAKAEKPTLKTKIKKKD